VPSDGGSGLCTRRRAGRPCCEWPWRSWTLFGLDWRPIFYVNVPIGIAGLVGYSPLHTALSMIPFTVGVGLGSGIAPQLMVHGRKLVLAGALVMAAGMGLVLGAVQRYGTGLHSWQLIPCLVIAGFGMAMVAGTLVNIVLARVPTRHSGAASSLINTTIQVRPRAWPCSSRC
jgi:hypothetical protein